MAKLSETSINLFFTKGVSLASWNRIGMLDREVLLYRQLAEHVAATSFITYGNSYDLDFTKTLSGIKIICNKWRLPRKFYEFIIINFYARFFPKPAILKSNQINGADIALKAALSANHTFLARCGYLPSNIMAWRHGEASLQAVQARALEQKVFQQAEHINVTTHSIMKTLIERYSIETKTISIIPNYIDTDCFAPQPELKQNKVVCYVGRLEKEKNVEALIDGLVGLDVSLIIVGNGPLKNSLQKKSQEKNLKVTFLGNILNSKLPQLLNSASIFILPSYLEHHPKALLEAMSCGLPVIGTNVYGIKDVIHHGENGILCGTKADEIRDAVKSLIDVPKLHQKLGKNAREYIINCCSAKNIIKKELEVWQNLSKNM